MENIKYVILDMGKVLVKPTTGHWYVTPVFVENVDITQINREAMLKAMDEYNPILDEKIISLEEEYEAVYKFYRLCFEAAGYDIPEQNLENIVRDFVYNETDTKYTMYDDVAEQLESLSKKYTVLLLSDNWPCAIEYLKTHDIYKYFDTAYISSVYGEKKCEGNFFDRPIRDYNIKPGEAVFVDDNPKLLDIATQKGLEVLLMDREQRCSESKYKIIHSLAEIDKKIDIEDIEV